MRLASFRAAAAVVPQECALFNTTLLDNIAYGRANASREEARAAADAAQLTAALGALPSGLDTVVGERGVKLSGGAAAGDDQLPTLFAIRLSVA